MATRRLPVARVGAEVLAPHLDAICSRANIPLTFTPDALTQAERAAEQWRALVDATEFTSLDWDAHVAATADPVSVVSSLPVITPGVNPAECDALLAAAVPTLDATAIPFVTIDPPESTDLDQAVCLLELPDGGRVRYLVLYAIASVATFITPGSALDEASWERGTTVYLPDRHIPLHPPCLSSGAASLLPGQVCPAYVWAIALNAEGASITARVDRAFVRSRAKLSYAQVQAASHEEARLPGEAPERLPELLRRIGELRLGRERDRGGVSARIPEQEIRADQAGYTLVYRENMAAEEWNAQISLLTGMSAARLMRAANLGIMRTLPPARTEDLTRLRHVATALGVDWPASTTYPELVRSLNPAIPAHAAFLLEGTSLFRGSGYRAFGVAGTQPLPRSAADGIIHGAIAAEYAHVTAPLRRLVDRYGEEVCLAHCAHTPVAEWVREALEKLPDVMAATGSRANSATRQALRVVQSLLLRNRVGETIAGMTVDVKKDRTTVMLSEPAVTAECPSRLPLGVAGQFVIDAAGLDDPRILVHPDPPLRAHT